MEKVEHFLANEAKGTKIVGATSLEDMVSKLKSPKRVMLLVKAGSAVDAFIDKLVSECVSYNILKLKKRCPQIERECLHVPIHLFVRFLHSIGFVSKLHLACLQIASHSIH